MTITYRRAVPEDKPAIFAFLDKAYGENARYKYPERWEWQFENNPFRDPDQLPVWLAIDENVGIVAQVATQVEPLKLKSGLRSKLFWGVDLIVLPEFRYQKLGSEINKHMIEENKGICAIALAETTKRFLRELGVEEVDVIYAFQKYLYVDSNFVMTSLVNRLGTSPVSRFFLKVAAELRLGKVFTGCVNCVLKWQSRPKSLLKDLSIIEVCEFDASWDQFWTSVADEFDIIVERTSQFLNWKYVQQPFLNYKLFLARRNDATVGYVILRRSNPLEGDFGIIADMLCSPRDSACLNVLLEHAIDWFDKQRVRVIYAASSHPDFQKSFIAHKFTMYKEAHPLFRNFDTTPDLETNFESGRWFFSRSDHDWDQLVIG